MKRRALLTILLYTCLMQTACPAHRVEVRLASLDERLPTPAFTIRNGQEPNYYSFGILDVTDDSRLGVEGVRRMWGVRSTTDEVPSGVVEHFRYGETLPGFEVEQSPLPLRPNRIYMIIVTSHLIDNYGRRGAEINGSWFFRADESGRIVAHGGGRSALEERRE